MQVKDAIERAEKSDEVKKLHGYFLCSCFASIKDKDEKVKEWTLLFYNHEKKVVLDCFVNEKFVTIGEETPPISDVERPDLSGLKITVDEALEKVVKNFSKSIINILITLHSKKSLVWTINLITKDMMATTFDIDANSGEIVREETTSLISQY